MERQAMGHASTRILHVTPSLDPFSGGVPAAVHGMALGQAQAGLQVAVAAAFFRKRELEVAAALDEAGVEVHFVGPVKGRRQRHGDWKRVLVNLADEADAIHVHGLWERPQEAAAAAGRARSLPVVVSPHGMLDPWSLNHHRWRKQVAWNILVNGWVRRASLLHAATDGEAANINRLQLGPDCEVVGLGVDLEAFHDLPSPEAWSRRRPEIGGRQICLFLSRIHPVKGLEILLDAFEGAAAACPSLILAVAGDADGGAYEASVRERVSRSPVASRIHLMGRLDGEEKREAFAAASFFVLPSYQENFGIVVAEAAAAGLPVLVSSNVQLKDFVRDSGAGEVLPLDAASFETAMVRLARSEPVTDARERVREIAFRTFDWRLIGERWSKIYENLSLN